MASSLESSYFQRRTKLNMLIKENCTFTNDRKFENDEKAIENGNT